MARFSAKAKSRFYSNLEKYARSGIGIERACESMLDQPGLKSAEREVLNKMLDGIQHGDTIANALARSRVKLSDVEIEIVHAAEKGGLLEKGFAHLGNYFQHVHRTRRRILSGLAYPIIVAHFAVPITIFTISMLRSGIGGDNVTAWESIRELGTWALRGYLILLALIFLTQWIWKWARNITAADHFFNRLPIIGRARRSLALARFCEVFHIDLLAGMRMSEALEGSGNAAQSGVIKNATTAGIKIVAEGRPLSDAIFGFPAAFPNDFARGIAAAEESGELDKEFAHWAHFYNEDAGQAMENLAVWTPKIVYGLVVGLVAFLVIRVALTYRSLLENIMNGNF